MPDARLVPRLAIIMGDTAFIPLGVKAKYGYALVDNDMAWLADQYKWTLEGTKRYAVTGTYEHEGRRISNALMHRVVMGMPKSGMIDHISRDPLDNRRSNLRIVDARMNQINTGLRGGSSKYRGVFWDKRVGKWCAKIKNFGKGKFLGYFDNEKEAAQAYNIAAIGCFGSDAPLNNIK